MNDDDFPYTRDPAAGPKETFPRGPSNEQTLLAELGQARATIFEMTKVAIKSAAEYVALEKKRDALAVTAERLREWLGLALANTYDMGMTTEDRRKLAEAEVFLKETAP